MGVSRDVGSGLHIIGDLKGCQNLLDLGMSSVRERLSSLLKENGFTELGNFYHEFDDGGFTGIIALSESHVSVHTWPHLGTVNVDVYTCNYQHDNTEPTRKMFEELITMFHPEFVVKREVFR